MSSRRLVRWEDLSLWLLSRVPDLRPRYEQEIKDWRQDPPSAYFVLGMVLKPHVLDLLDHGREAEVQRIFDLLDHLAQFGDDSIRNELRVTMEGMPTWRVWGYLSEGMREDEFDRITWYPERKDRYTPANAHVDKSHYRERWREEIMKIGGFENLTGTKLMTIRYKLVTEFGISGLRAFEPGGVRWILEGFPPLPPDSE